MDGNGAGSGHQPNGQDTSRQSQINSVMPADQLLLMPAHPVKGQSSVSDLAIETRLLPNGRTVAMAFTHADKLVAALGESQPWVLVRAGGLKDLLAGTGVNVLLDPEVAPDAPRWTAGDLQKIRAGQKVSF
jgi:hypothetical protein